MKNIWVMLCLWMMPWLVSLSLAAEIVMGPRLIFEAEHQHHKLVEVRALYAFKLKPHEKVPLLLVQGKASASDGKVLYTKFAHTIVAYTIYANQQEHESEVWYKLPEETSYKSFYVNGLTADEHFEASYGSCYGYQRLADKIAVGGLQPMWQRFNARHAQKHMHLHFNGGDLIYADGINKEEDCRDGKDGYTNGINAVPAVKKWRKLTQNNKDQAAREPFTAEAAEQVEFFYLNQYIKQFNEEDLKEGIASVPNLAQWDDHDLYDGCGSYELWLQNSPYMVGIRKIATEMAFIMQHGLGLDKFPKPRKNGSPRGYHFIKIVDNGKLAIVGVDTRTERTADQVVSEKSWIKIFDELYKLDKSVKHVAFMLAIPVVYAPAAPYERARKIPFLGYLINKAMPSAYGGHCELDDDMGDHWSSEHHIAERNTMIERLQNFATERQIQTHLFGGDVHVGCIGEICSNKVQFNEAGDRIRTFDHITQFTSSPMGNVPVEGMKANGIGYLGSQKQECNNDCTMNLFALKDEYGKDAPMLLSTRNFVTFHLNDTEAFEVNYVTEKLGNFNYVVEKASFINNEY